MNIERARYLRGAQLDMLDCVYSQQNKVLLEQLQIIAMRNQTLLSCNSNTFMYAGTWYTAGDQTNNGYDYTPNRELHTDLKLEVKELLNKKFETKIQESILLAHFGDILVTAQQVGDLYELLPYPIHDIVSLIEGEVFDIGPALTKKEICQFKEKHLDGIRCLNSMFLLELLLSK